MHTIILAVFGFIASFPLVHATFGGYVKSMLENEPAATDKDVDPRLYSIWSSFHKIYQEAQHAATATASDHPAAPTGEAHDLVIGDEYYTIPNTDPQPTPEITGEVTIYSTVTYSGPSCSGPCPTVVPPPLTASNSSAVVTRTAVPVTSTIHPSQNTTAAVSSTSTKTTSGPTSVPPPLNGVSRNVAPVMGAVAVVIAGCLMF
ncbi:hypothetical protein Trco_002925 [Trichoderma cornu-damae]|uniref:Uncharacterized protein n=1 Tax=Trichoderma cornu-damae TaxID=654480 RepID=A0A9P8TZK8_9HYPO|nr:hypothetical protein Trco_002925 [Trichoderma cornu-damae]